LELNLKEGIKEVKEITVTENDLATEVGSGLLKVYATPKMIVLMEKTSYSLIQPYLPNGYSSVGIEVNVKHLHATPPKMKVKCESVLKKIKGKRLLFEVNAWDEKQHIGTGTHTRYVIDIDRFIKNIGK